MTVDEPLGGVLDALVRFETRLAALVAPLGRLLEGPAAARPARRVRRRPALRYATGAGGSSNRNDPGLAA